MTFFIKIHAGDWKEQDAIVHQVGWRQRICITISRGFFRGSDKYFLDTDIKSVEIVTEENKKRILGTAAWATAGIMTLGPVGLLAGLLLGGKGKDITFVCHFTDGKKILATTNHKRFKHFQLPALKNALSQ